VPVDPRPIPSPEGERSPVGRKAPPGRFLLFSLPGEGRASTVVGEYRTITAAQIRAPHYGRQTQIFDQHGNEIEWRSAS
jgi:hypothetical protein